MKKLLAVFLSIVMIFSLAIPAFAVEEKTNYPFIYVHGMAAWGEGNPLEEIVPNWSSAEGEDIIPILNEMGYEVYNPAVGTLSSAWDRACDLYARLTGTLTDYGEAHSAECGHDRYGRDYTGQAIMGEPWDMKTPLNLVGHSFGGETVRYLTSLLAYGDESEQRVSGNNCSELFKGGHPDAVNAVINLSSPHNGSQVANKLYDGFTFAFVVMCFVNVIGIVNSIIPIYDPQMDQWGISGDNVGLRIATMAKVAEGKDNCAYDLTLRGASELNTKIKTVPDVYYYSYTSCCSGTPEFEGVKPDFSVFVFDLSYKVILESAGTVVDGIEMTDEWVANDGIVPLKSALYPDSEEDNHEYYSDAKEIVSGKWYVMPTLMGTDHYDFSRGTDFPMGYIKFYTDMMDLVNSNGVVTKGDVNLDGKVNSTDALAVLRYCSDSEILSMQQEKAADANCDGEINSTDALCILKM